MQPQQGWFQVPAPYREAWLALGDDRTRVNKYFEILMELTGERHLYQTSPAVADVNGDGLEDIVVGNPDGTLRLLKNMGNQQFEELNASTEVDPFQGIQMESGFSAPSFADLDGDGDLDLIVGSGDGSIRVFNATIPPPNITFGNGTQTNTTNSTNATVPVPFAYVEWGYSNDTYFAVTSTGMSKAAFADLTSDGLLDMVLGGANGELEFYENMGSKGKPIFTLSSPLVRDMSQLGPHTSPTFLDVNGDGVLELVVGSVAGGLQVLERDFVQPENSTRSGDQEFANCDVNADCADTTVDVSGVYVQNGTDSPFITIQHHPPLSCAGSYLWIETGGPSWTINATEDPLVFLLGADYPYVGNVTQFYTEGDEVSYVLGPGNLAYVRLPIIEGVYELGTPKNGSHYVTISSLHSPFTYLWTDRTGSSWTLNRTKDPLVFTIIDEFPDLTPPAEAPVARFVMENGEVAYVMWFGNEPFQRKGDLDPCPCEQCVCIPGYSGSGFAGTCADVDECVDQTHNCNNILHVHINDFLAVSSLLTKCLAFGADELLSQHGG
eukprot:1943902-Rhodomonas_salina.1